MKTKRTILTQMLRILLPCSRLIPWESVTYQQLPEKMQHSGYSQAFRYNVTRSAVNAYQTMRENETNHIRPIYCPKDWHKEEYWTEREKNERMVQTGRFWYCPFCTNNSRGKLKHMYEKEIREWDRMKVVEQTGQKSITDVKFVQPVWVWETELFYLYNHRQGKLCNRKYNLQNSMWRGRLYQESIRRWNSREWIHLGLQTFVGPGSRE